MSNKTILLGIMMGLGAMTNSVYGQESAEAEDLVAGKEVYLLGQKEWSKDDGTTFTCNVNDLQKLTAVPANTSNVYLFPEGGWNNAENIEIGIQGFYIDMGKVAEVRAVNTTWEGAAADSFEIFLTNDEPTEAVLNTTPVYSVKGLGQYQSNQAILPGKSKGRYIVFQPTNASNYAWGVKMRSISVLAAADIALTSISVSPIFITNANQTELTIKASDQFGVEIPLDDLNVTVSENASLNNGFLTINSGLYAEVSVEYEGTVLSQTVYVPSVPSVPSPSEIMTAVFTNGQTQDNNAAGWGTGYNGGAINIGEVTFPNGEVAWAFDATRCVFMYNKTTTGEWDSNIYPKQNGWRTLKIDIYGTSEAAGTINFEGGEWEEDAENKSFTYPFELKAGQWNEIEVDVEKAIRLNNMSVRFDEANACPLLFTNIYFTPTFIEGDEEAPVITSLEATPGKGRVDIKATAADDKANEIIFTITGGEQDYSFTSTNGVEANYTIEGLEYDKEYTFYVTASDGKNISKPQSVTFTTLGEPAAILTWTTVNGYEKGRIYYTISLRNIPQENFKSVEMWGDVPGGLKTNVVNSTELADLTGTLELDMSTFEVNAAADVYLKGKVTYVGIDGQEVTIITAPYDRAVKLIRVESDQVSVFLSGAEEGMVLTADTQLMVSEGAEANYTISYKVTIDSDETIELSGTLTKPMTMTELGLTPMESCVVNFEWSAEQADGTTKSGSFKGIYYVAPKENEDPVRIYLSSPSGWEGINYEFKSTVNENFATVKGEIKNYREFNDGIAFFYVDVPTTMLFSEVTFSNAAASSDSSQSRIRKEGEETPVPQSITKEITGSTMYLYNNGNDWSASIPSPGDITTGIEELEPDAEIENAEEVARYYTIQGGMAPEPLAPGMYIKVANGKSSKILVK